ncbi:MAG: hypothetical protein FJX53_00440 [Alphaproteobacteria bacterium]|nr:hypothetical protein [Alphaproteobacteria bacterium]
MAVGVAALAAFAYWDSLPRQWLVDERPGIAGRTDVALSVDANGAGTSGARLTLTCRDGRIGAEISPVFVQCIGGDCDGPGLVMSLSQTFETFIYPNRASHTSWAAPWIADRGTARARRTFEDGPPPPGPDDSTGYPVDSEAFITRLLAAKTLSISMGTGHMSFDARRFAEVLPRLHAGCPARAKAPPSGPGGSG